MEHNFSTVEETIAEVESPLGSPTFEPKVPMPSEPKSPKAEKPSVAMPGGHPRIPSPTSTINTLELIGFRMLMLQSIRGLFKIRHKGIQKGKGCQT